MPSDKSNNKGIALFLVIATILIVILLSNVILNIAASQSRLTHHQVSRIQGQYAAQAGIVFALDRLRAGTLNGQPFDFTSCPAGTPCKLSVIDTEFTNNFPRTISDVEIVIRAPGVDGCNAQPDSACVSAKAIYAPVPAAAPATP